MTDIDDSPERRVTEQHNHGDGAFVGGDNHGEIHIEALDEKTKALLEKISDDSPALAEMLEEALTEGLISSETATLLALAARSINEDVADTLLRAAQSINEDVAGLISRASRSINEDVAGLLTEASRSINEDVAGQMSHVADTLVKVTGKLDIDELGLVVNRFENAISVRGSDDLMGLVSRLEKGLSSIDRLAQDLENMQRRDKPLGRIEEIGSALNGAADRIEATVTPPPPKVLPDHRARLFAFAWGVLAGALFILYMANR
ncbi:hypothetical protein FM076_14065 [Streptomyces albus subsp. chlorinus]|uniref:hypothetical protein n=1 Tax=Streptomyces albus TaxID=1888 RepID=UPI00156E8650|nr:hypothetical protein [Streptomyces albus]NSC22253.1 hypothetical protein [Streptomyces albus subsp. chlorinus]